MTENDEEKIKEFYFSLLSKEGNITESTLRIVHPRDPVDKVLGVSSSEEMFMFDDILYDKEGKMVMTEKLFLLPQYYELSIIRKGDRSIKNRL